MHEHRHMEDLMRNPKNLQDHTGVLRRQDKIARASRLLAAGLRPKIVAIDTGLSAPVLRDLYADIRGERPRPGPLQSPEGILCNRQRVAEASCLLALYARLAGKPAARIDLDALVRAHELQSQVTPLSLTCNQAWVLARAMRSRSLRIDACRICRAPLVALEGAALSCPFCRLGNDFADTPPNPAATPPGIDGDAGGEGRPP